MNETWCGLIHGEPGAGKSWLGQTTPAPRLVLDAEGGSRSPKRVIDGKVQRIKQVTWDPHSENPPAPSDWEVCRVVVKNFDTLQRVYDWLITGKTCFRSVVVDSLTEAQKRCKDALKAQFEEEVMNERMWGMLLDRMEKLIRDYRDLVFDDTNGVDVVLILALTREVNYKWVPAVQGALGVSLPGYVDTVGFLAAAQSAETGEDEWLLLIKPHPQYAAKDRTHTLSAHYGHVITNPDIGAMLDVINQED